MTVKEKKARQLGMNPGTAAHQLRTDILWRFIDAAGHACHHCGLPLTRDDFSIEHIVPWLDSDDPLGRFFDPANIAFSHLACNVRAARRPRSKSPIPLAARRAAARKATYCPEARRARYLRLGT